MNLSHRIAAAASCFVGLTACATEKASSSATAEEAAPVAAAPDCNPIVGNDCLSGFPTNFYLRDDATTATSHRLDLPLSAMPTGGLGPILPAEWNRRDGFSPNAPTVILLAKKVDPHVLADETRPANSLKMETATVMLDAQTGKLIEHFAENDLNADDVKRTALVLRAWTPIQENKRVVVALTDKLLDIDGKPYVRSAAFQRIADGKLTGYPRIDAHIADWRSDLELLEKAGFTRDHLLAAWHYDTASEAWTHGVALSMRDQLVAAVGEKGLGYKIDQIEVDPQYVNQFPNLPTTQTPTNLTLTVAPMHIDVALRVRGQFESPLFLKTSGTDGTLNYVTGGPQVVQNGTFWRPFILLVPPSVVNSSKSAQLLLYGHGLLRGACVEGCVKPGDAEFFPHFVNGLGAVAVATDWWGLSQVELGVAVNVTNDFNLTTQLTDKLAQSTVLPIALTRVVRGKVLADPLLAMGNNKIPPADSSKDLVYYGNSLGGIMGTTMTSLHPDLTRMVMNVAGGIWSMLLNRSSNFGPFLQFVAANYPDKYTQQQVFGLTQSLWDLSDPINFADHSVKSPFANTKPNRRALWPISWGDSQVPNLSSGMLARVADVPLLVPAVADWAGNTTESSLPFIKTNAGQISSFVQWDPQRGVHPPGNLVPAEDNGAHYATRWMPEFQQMIWRFLLDDGAVEPRYCLKGGRDSDGVLPCSLKQDIPKSEKLQPPLVTLPPPQI